MNSIAAKWAIAWHLEQEGVFFNPSPPSGQRVKAEKLCDYLSGLKGPDFADRKIDSIFLPGLVRPQV